MKNKYGFTAYVIMAVLIFIIAVALILAAINIKSNKASFSSKDKEILEYVNYSVTLCEEACSSSKATDEEMENIDDYINNINSYENIRTKANIALAMLTNTADMLADKASRNVITETTATGLQNEISMTMAELENSLKFE